MLESLQTASRELLPAAQLAGSAVGDYEVLSGTATFAVDPLAAANAAIVDLELAPRDPDGLVRCTADWWMLRPVDAAKSNGILLYDVVNRGNKVALSQFHDANRTPPPGEPTDYGNGWFFERGVTLAAVGWQGDIIPGPGRLSLTAPVARAADGTQITGPIRMALIPNRPSRVLGLLARPDHSYHSPVDLEEPTASLTVRRSPYDAPVAIGRDRWAFATEERDGTLRRPSGRHILYEDGFEPGKVYEVVYTAADPVVMGLGLATTRDFVSFLRHHATDVAGAPNPLWSGGRSLAGRVIGFGSSQSGRYLREFLYQGFNADEEGRIVFDGVHAHIGGAGRGSFNHRFAQPTRTRAHANGIYPIEVFPFADLPSTDPVSGRSEGLLDRARAAGVVPKVMYTNSSAEYWGAGASLIHTTADGSADMPIPGEVRVYHFAGTQHVQGQWPPQQEGGYMVGIPYPLTTYPVSPTRVSPAMRALMLAMEAWVLDGTEPPASAYPKVADGTLATRDAYLKNFPQIPAVEHTDEMGIPRLLDYGPRWDEGIIDTEPPTYGPLYGALVPNVNADGNEAGGLQLPELTAPLATYTGWNRRHPETGEPGLPFWVYGSYFPFPESKEVAGDDPRVPILERYRDREEYLARVEPAIADLVQRRLLLERDIDGARRRAAAQWDAHVTAARAAVAGA